MKKFSVLFSVLFLLNFLHADDINNFYRNEEAGFAVNFTSEWVIYTSHENSIEASKPYFEQKDNGESIPLFPGMTKNQSGYVHCFAEKTDLNSLLPEKNIDKIETTADLPEKKKDLGESYRLTENDRLFFYEVKGEKNIVYILGSIHLGHPEFYPMPDRIEDAFRNSKYLAVEINSDSADNKKKLMGNKSLLYNKNDKTLKDVLPENLYAKLEEVFRETGMSIDNYKKMKPWVISSVVVMFQSMKLGFSPQYGIDKYFINKAWKKKEIKELETIDYQIDLFEKKINQEDYLASVLLDYKLVKYKVKDLINAWRSGDEDVLEKLTIGSFSPYKETGVDMLEALIYKRNNEMAEKIKEFLKDESDYFVVVGAGHIIGERGIISILKKAGFKAEKK